MARVERAQQQGQSQERRLELLNQKEAATLLGLSSKTLEGWRWMGRGPKYLKLGRLVRYRLDDIEDFIRKQEQRGGME